MLLQLFLASVVLFVNAQRTCSTIPVPTCSFRASRDLMFLVDASDSLDVNLFQTQTMNYIQSIFCAFNPADTTRAAMITFAGSIEVRIPMARYTAVEWFEKVDEQRALNLCCSCCTPTATAFLRAYQHMTANPPANDAYPIVFMITDGAPWQNTNGEFAFPALNPGTYTWVTVPEQANLVKSISDRTRVMMVGIPNKFGDTPRVEYFQGIPDPSKKPPNRPLPWQRITRNGRDFDAQMLSPPFPIVSQPVDKNIFSSQSNDAEELIRLTVTSLCEILPTNTPTRKPTTSGPTASPTKLPTRLPTNPVPTFAPTRLPTRQPTFAPTNEPTKLPTFAPTKQPTAAPTNQPTKQPTLAPTKEPTKLPTFRPTSSPSNAPQKPILDGIDMYLLLDRSRSMTWVPEICKNAPGGNPSDANNVACWKLFLNFVSKIVKGVVATPYLNTNVGWFGDFPAGNVRRGVRVWLYGFACTGHQSIPVTIKIGEAIGKLADFDAAMAEAAKMIPDGGTCPGEAIEKAAGVVMGNAIQRLYKTALLFTDGVFYDMPRPAQAVQGLFHFGVLTYALGVSIPQDGNNYGLTPNEIIRQRNQLSQFVGGDESRIFNFGVDGLTLLNAIADAFVEQLPYDAIANLPNVVAQPWWCGWTNEPRCVEMDPAFTQTGLYCKWTQKNFCAPKSFCKYKAADCKADPYCELKGKRCVAKPGVKP